jgi:hypothetical protein
MKKLLISLLLGASCWVLAFNQVSAATNLFVQITDLPEYKNTDTFKVSYTALQINGDSIDAKFSYHKEGDSWKEFATVSGSSNSAEVTGSQINGGDGKYYFKVDVTSGVDAVSDETSTTIDRSGPDAPSDYGKDKIADNAYRLNWKTPNNDDLSYVAVYRSKDQNFTADSGTLVIQVGGAKDTKITWEDHGLEINRDYFYALRAMDKAGNASGVVGDGGTTTLIEVTPTPGGSTTGQVKLLPKENTEGQILGGETEDLTTPTPESQAGLSNALGEATKVVTGMSSGQRILWALIILGIFGGGYYFFKNRSSE